MLCRALLYKIHLWPLASKLVDASGNGMDRAFTFVSSMGALHTEFDGWQGLSGVEVDIPQYGRTDSHVLTGSMSTYNADGRSASVSRMHSTRFY